VLLAGGTGLLGEDVCRSCRGRFLAAGLTERVVVDELGVDRAMLRELVTHFSGARLRCCGCGASMRPLRLRGVVVDLCLACGGLWLDAGELSRMTGGRYDEVGAATSDVLPSPTTGSGASASTVDGRPRVVLGRGHSVVVLDSLTLPPERVLHDVFAGTDGLTSIDVEQLTRFLTGVVVEGVAPSGAAGVVERFAAHGVVAHVLGEGALRLPAPVLVERLVVEDVRAPRNVVAHYAVGPSSTFSRRDVRAVAAARLPDPARRTAVLPVLDVVLGASPTPGGEVRRLRWHIIDDDVGLGPVFALATANRLPALPPLDGDPTSWPLLTPREHERRLAWSLWRATT
jgi:hypothetical protein